MGYLISPLLWVFLAFIIYFFSRKRKYFIFGVSVLYFFTAPIFFNFVAQFIEKPVQNPAKLVKADWGILLGGIASYDAENEVILFSENSARVLAAIELYKNRKIDKLFIAAGAPDTANLKIIEAVYLKRFFVNAGIPEEKIGIDYKSANTIGNARNAARALKPNSNNGNYILISSSYHLKRAQACFRKAGFENLQTYSAHQLRDKPKLKFSQLVPREGVLQKWHYILHEIVGLAAYRLMGYI